MWSNGWLLSHFGDLFFKTFGFTNFPYVFSACLVGREGDWGTVQEGGLLEVLELEHPLEQGWSGSRCMTETLQPVVSRETASGQAKLEVGSGEVYWVLLDRTPFATRVVFISRDLLVDSKGFFPRAVGS